MQRVLARVADARAACGRYPLLASNRIARSVAGELQKLGALGTLILCGICVAMATTTGEMRPALSTLSTATVVVAFINGRLSQRARTVRTYLSGPVLVMAYLLVYDWMAPQAANLTVALWPVVFAFVGVTVPARVGIWLLPVAAVGISMSMDLRAAQEVPRWLILMGLVVVVSQLPARLMNSIDDRQRMVDAEHQAVITAQQALASSMDRFEHAFAASPIGMGLFDQDGLVIEANAALCHLVGKPGEKVIGRPARAMTNSANDLVDTEQDAVWRAEIGQNVVRESVFSRLDGSDCWVEVTLVPVRGVSDEVWTLAHVQDVTARHLSAEAEERAQQVSHVLADVIRSVVHRREEIRDAVTRGAQRLTGASSVVMMESHDDWNLVVTGCTDERALGTTVDLGQLSATATVWETGVAVDVVDVASAATVNPALAQVHGVVSAYFQPVLGPQDEVLAVLAATWHQSRSATSSDVRQAMDVLAAEAGAALYHDGVRHRLETSVSTDPLTKLLNRRGWDEGLTRLVDQTASEGVVAVAMIDLDKFKTYNDLYGHARGDDLLVAFAQALGASVREGDLISRWGGDEFAIAMRVAAPSQAQAIVDRVSKAVPAGQTCSIGLAVHDSGTKVTATLARADEALYRVKQSGRDGIAVA